MYKLENDEVLTNQIKNAFKRNVVKNKAIFNDEKIGEINESNYLNESTLEELRYVPEQGFIGQCVARRVTLKIENEDNQFNLENKEFIYKLGAEIPNEEGKNSYDFSKIVNGRYKVIDGTLEQITDESYTIKTTDTIYGTEFKNELFMNYTKVKPNTTYTFSSKISNTEELHNDNIIIGVNFYDDEYKLISLERTPTAHYKGDYGENLLYITFETPINAEYVDFFSLSNLKPPAKEFTVTFFDMQLEENSFPTEYVKYEETRTKTHYINYGNFIVQAPENDDVNQTTEFEALDYMCKFNQKYVCGISDWSNTSLYSIALDVCRQCGVELGSTVFTNSTELISQNPFINGEQCRDVIQSIAKLAFSWARIGQDNKLYIDFNPTNLISETIDIDGYINLEINNETKPITAIVLKSSITEAEGEEEIPVEGVIIKADGKPCWEGGPTYPDLISEYGENQLVITEDYYAYDEATRRRFILGASKLFGLKYFPINVDLLGSAYLDSNDFIEIINMKDISLKTYCLNQTINYNGVLYNTIESEAPTEIETHYTYEGTDLTVKQTQIIVNKAEQKITATVSDLKETVDGYDGKITQIQADLSGVISQVSQFVDLTNTVIGQKKLTIEKAVQGTLLRLRIFGNDTVFGGWYFDDNWYFDNDKYFSDGSEILVNNIPYDLKITTGALRYLNENVYDEYVYDYEKLETYVIRRVGVTSAGVEYELTNPIYEYITGSTTGNPFVPINLVEGNNTIEIVYYSANMEAKFVAQNEYSNIFATKIELNSSIKQTERNINLSVDEKIQGIGDTYASKAELDIQAGQISTLVTNTNNLSSQIKQTAGQIEMQVTQTEQGKQAGIKISVLNSDGEVIDSANGRIDMTGLVSFSNLSGSGTTTINGANITTGTIQGERLNVTKLNATSGTIAGIGLNDQGIYYFGGPSYDGFGLWKSNIHSSTTPAGDNSYIIFHAGGNGQHIGDAVFRVYQNGCVFAKQLYTDENYIFTKTRNVNHIEFAGNYTYLEVNGYSPYGSYGIFFNVSDERLKKNIKLNSEKAMDIINKIEHYEFDWRKDGKHEKNGYKAQQLKEVNEDFVFAVKQPEGSEYDEILQVNEFKMQPYITKGLQENYKEIQDLKEENKQMKEIINNLLERIEKLENKEDK